MIIGINADFEPIIPLLIRDFDRKVYTQDAIVNTGFIRRDNQHSDCCYHVSTSCIYTMSNSYSIRSTKIGNSAGFRLPVEFYREYPQFANADGLIEVLSPDTALVKIIPQSSDDEDHENSLIMRLFLDFAMTEVLKNNTLQPYTAHMSEAAHELIDGVVLEDES